MIKNKSHKMKKSSFKAISVIFFGACLVLGVFSFQYYNHLQNAIRDESRGYLEEIARRVSSNVDRIISDNYGALISIASTLKTYDAQSFDDIQPLVETQRDIWNFQDLMLIDEAGKAYDAAGQEVILNNSSFFDAAIAGKQGITATQMINNEESIMFVTPLEGMMIDGKKMIALGASYAPAVFEQTLSMSSFSGQASSSIVTQDGTVAIRSSAENTVKFGYNVLSSVGESQMDEGDSVQNVKDDMKVDRAGQIGFTQTGTRYYMVYTPISPEGWYLLIFVPANVVNEKSDMLLSVTLILCGAITLIFAGLLSVLMYTAYRNRRKLERIAYVDEITDGNTIQRFYELAKEALSANDGRRYALVYTNLQKFKVMNEQFGRQVCDGILAAFYSNISKTLKNNECIGRLSADNFCILLEYENEASLLAKFNLWYEAANRFIGDNKPAWSLPITEFGVYVFEEDAIEFSQSIDRAKLALREFSRIVNGKLRYAVYNNEAHEKLFREKHLEDMMEQALKDKEFQVYLQPKYFMPDLRVGGAEALARWKSKSEGMIYPSEFIPLFEKNGFIIQLDLYVFEEICKHLREWLDAGISPVKVSVNCSRVQLNDPDFLSAYRRISETYSIPPELIEIELTESVVMEDVHRLAQIIDDIHAIGFGCSMDDFGSGYSSLNLIQAIPVDTLKLDKIFFQNGEKDARRTESVVGSIVSMAKALSMTTVAEGVELHEQVEMLKRIGCDYIQGFVFAKPMPICEFEELAFGLKKE